MGRPIRLRNGARWPTFVTMRPCASEPSKPLVYPEVILNGHQALSIANGFDDQVAKSGYIIHACSILPCHVHMVVKRHHYRVEQVMRLLRQAGSLRLLSDNLHPFAKQRAANGRLFSIWAQDGWKVFLYTLDEIRDRIEYVENNPVREGKRLQHWRFVTPFDPTAYV